MTTFNGIQLKAVSADLAKNTIKLTFTMERTPENMEKAEELAPYADSDARAVDIAITPKQTRMKGT